jgi:hypothetical protein
VLGVHKETGATRKILDRGASSIDAKIMVKSGKHFLEFDRSIIGFTAITSRGSNDLPVGHASAGKESR